MNDDLVRLGQLDDIDREVARIDTAIETARQRLESARVLSERREAERSEAAAALDANRHEERSGQRRLEELRQSREAALRVLQSGAGSPEAAERQFARCEGLIDEGETAQLEILEKQDELVAALALADRTLGEAQAELKRLEREVPAEIAGHEAARKERIAARGPVFAALPAELSGRYESFRARGRWAVARIHDTTCDACAMTVQPQMIVDLRKGRLVACHGCHRWLILPE